MRKLILIIMMVAMVAVAAIPAVADTLLVQDAYSGDVVQAYESNVAGWGNAVANNVEFDANTGNYQNQESYQLYGNVQYDNVD